MGSYTIRYDSVYLTCSKKLTGSQLSLPHGNIVIALRLLIFMCPEKKLTRGPEQYVSLIVAGAAGAAGAAFSNTRIPRPLPTGKNGK